MENTRSAKHRWQSSLAYQALKRRVVASQDGACADCGMCVSLELHHLVYPQETMIGGDFGDWGDETDDEVICLCRECHFGRHVDRNGEFWFSETENYWYWVSFDEDAH